MSAHQQDEIANQVDNIFQAGYWMGRTLFPVYRKEMKGIELGLLYNSYKDAELDPDELEIRVSKLMADDEVGNKKGIYAYVLNGDERNLNLRAFSDTQKREAYERQQGICPICKKHFEYEQMHGDHITPWHAGGKTVPENLQMLCRDCNLKKSGEV